LSQCNVGRCNAGASVDMCMWPHMSPLLYPMTSSHIVNKDSAEMTRWVTIFVCVWWSWGITEWRTLLRSG